MSFNFQETEFKIKLTGSTTGSCIILHYSMTVKPDLIDAKFWIGGQRSLTEAFNNGHFNFDGLRA